MTIWSELASLDDAIKAGLKEDEFNRISELVGRKVSVLEVGIFAALYSEHCSYKSTKVHLRTLPTEGPAVIEGPGENAGVIDIGDGVAVVFKVESHNHPSFIEPYQGAATGVGGILRDVFTMGARPVACMNLLRFGQPSNEKTAHLLSGAVAGIGGYGNCVGVPTVGGELYFNSSYDGNCLVNAFALGLVRHDKIFRASASGVGNKVLYVGSKTGRDGIHGATMSSEEFGENSEEKRPTVQVGDPFQEKLLIEACFEIMDKKLVVGIQDMGAAGLTSSTYEMADRAGTGVRVYLDKVPQREKGMNPYELMLSESQERMLLVCEPKYVDQIIKIVNHWELDAVEIGEVIEGKDVELFWNGECVSALPASVLTRSAPQYRWEEKAPDGFEENCKSGLSQSNLNFAEKPQELSKLWIDFLGSVNSCSRRWVYEQYDSTVRSNTVVHPGGDAAVIRVKNSEWEIKDTAKPERGVAMTLDCNSTFCAVDPRRGTALSVAEAVRNLSCVGATPIGLSNCLNFGAPHKPEGMWQIAEAIRGLGEAARAFSVPVVSGNVSLNNETKGKAIHPTPAIALVGLLEDSSKAIGASFKNVGDIVFLIGETFIDELGGSELLAWKQDSLKGPLPVLDYDLESKTNAVIRSLVDLGLLNSCHDLSVGGLASALAESCFANKLGVNLRPQDGWNTLKRNSNISVTEGMGFMFSESGARYLISFAADKLQLVNKLINDTNLKVCAKGSVVGNKISVESIAEISLEDAFSAWDRGLEKVIGTAVST
jgi:phosphoribosylformylglycinamidine synthase II